MLSEVRQIPKFIQKYLETQKEQDETDKICENLRSNVCELLADHGVKHTYWGDRVILIALSPLALPGRIPDLGPIGRVHERFLEITQSTYFGSSIKAGNKEIRGIVFANDGDPKRAGKIQIGIVEEQEVLILDKLRGHNMIACTEDSPMFNITDHDINFHGRRFDGKRYKELRSVTVADAGKYSELVKELSKHSLSIRYHTFLPLLGSA